MFFQFFENNIRVIKNLILYDVRKLSSATFLIYRIQIKGFLKKNLGGGNVFFFVKIYVFWQKMKGKIQRKISKVLIFENDFKVVLNVFKLFLRYNKVITACFDGPEHMSVVFYLIIRPQISLQNHRKLQNGIFMLFQSL